MRIWLFILSTILLSACSHPDRQVVDKLNGQSYAYHYRNIDSTEALAHRAYELAGSYDAGRAEALNNLAPFYEYDLLMGDTMVVQYCNSYSFAAGLTMVYRKFHEVSGAYVVGTSFDSQSGLVVTDVEPFTDYTFERSDSDTGTLSFVMPDIDHSSDKALVFAAT
jgi:hypothetical protein